MNDLQDLPPLRETIKRHGLDARKALGQHFLLDQNLTDRIARAGGDLRGCHVLEVGPGPGGLTRSILAAGADHVIAVERDHRCVAALQELAAAVPGRLTVLEQDALAADIPTEPDKPIKLIANLPYNISTPLLIKWLADPAKFQCYVLMFQKEVAARLTAEPGDHAYGRLSVTTQWRCQAERLFDVNPKAFTPPPKVVSTVVRLTPRTAPLAAADPERLSQVVAVAFGQRRKMIRTSLRRLFPEPEKTFQKLGLDPSARPETLTIPQFCSLANCLDAPTVSG